PHLVLHSFPTRRSSDLEIKDSFLYTKDHEWAALKGSALEIGITSFAVDQLGDITLVNIDAKVGDIVTAGAAFGTIESVKTLSDQIGRAHVELQSPCNLV